MKRFRVRFRTVAVCVVVALAASACAGGLGQVGPGRGASEPRDEIPDATQLPRFAVDRNQATTTTASRSANAPKANVPSSIKHPLPGGAGGPGRLGSRSVANRGIGPILRQTPSSGAGQTTPPACSLINASSPQDYSNQLSQQNDSVVVSTSPTICTGQANHTILLGTSVTLPGTNEFDPTGILNPINGSGSQSDGDGSVQFSSLVDGQVYYWEDQSDPANVPISSFRVDRGRELVQPMDVVGPLSVSLATGGLTTAFKTNGGPVQLTGVYQSRGINGFAPPAPATPKLLPQGWTLQGANPQWAALTPPSSANGNVATLWSSSGLQVPYIQTTSSYTQQTGFVAPSGLTAMPAASYPFLSTAPGGYSATDAMGSYTNFDPNGRLASAGSTQPGSMQYTYSNGVLVQITDPQSKRSAEMITPSTVSWFNSNGYKSGSATCPQVTGTKHTPQRSSSTLICRFVGLHDATQKDLGTYINPTGGATNNRYVTSFKYCYYLSIPNKCDSSKRSDPGLQLERVENPGAAVTDFSFATTRVTGGQNPNITTCPSTPASTPCLLAVRTAVASDYYQQTTGISGLLGGFHYDIFYNLDGSVEAIQMPSPDPQSPSRLTNPVAPSFKLYTYNDQSTDVSYTASYDPSSNDIGQPSKVGTVTYDSAYRRTSSTGADGNPMVFYWDTQGDQPTATLNQNYLYASDPTLRQRTPGLVQSSQFDSKGRPASNVASAPEVTLSGATCYSPPYRSDKAPKTFANYPSTLPTCSGIAITTPQYSQTSATGTPVGGGIKKASWTNQQGSGAPMQIATIGANSNQPVGSGDTIYAPATSVAAGDPVNALNGAGFVVYDFELNPSPDISAIEWTAPDAGIWPSGWGISVNGQLPNVWGSCVGPMSQPYSPTQYNQQPAYCVHIPVSTTDISQVRITYNWGAYQSTSGYQQPQFSDITTLTVDKVNSSKQASSLTYSDVDPGYGQPSQVTSMSSAGKGTTVYDYVNAMGGQQLDPFNGRVGTTTFIPDPNSSNSGNIQTSAQYDSSHYLRQTGSTLPAGNQLSSAYYSSTDTLPLSFTSQCRTPSDYWLTGQLKSATEPAPNTPPSGQTLNPQADTTGGGNTHENIYDGQGRIIGQRQTNAVSGNNNWKGAWTCLTYDARGRLKQTVVNKDLNNGSSQQHTITRKNTFNAPNVLVNSSSETVKGQTTCISQIQNLLGAPQEYVDTHGFTTSTVYDETNPFQVVGRMITGPSDQRSFGCPSGTNPGGDVSPQGLPDYYPAQLGPLAGQCASGSPQTGLPGSPSQGGGQPLSQECYTYSKGSAGRLTTIQHAIQGFAQPQISFGYSGASQFTSVVINGVTTASLSYDNIGLNGKTIDLNPDGQGVAHYLGAVTHGIAGEIANQSTTLNPHTSSPTTTTTSQSFDGYGRLAKAKTQQGASNFEQDYSYDPTSAGGCNSATGPMAGSVGEHVSAPVGANGNIMVPQTVNVGNRANCYNWSDQLTSSGTNSPGLGAPSIGSVKYNNMGSITELHAPTQCSGGGGFGEPPTSCSGGETIENFTYDAANRARAVTDSAGNSATYSYDPSGRISQYINKTAPAASQQSVSTTMYYNYTSSSGDGGPTVISDSSQNPLSMTFWWPGGIMQTVQLQRLTASNLAAQTTYTYTDLTNNAIFSTDGTGTVPSPQTQPIYDPYGNPVNTGGTAGSDLKPPENYPTTGYQADIQRQTEPSLAIPVTPMGARLYIPSLGIFAQRDPSPYANGAAMNFSVNPTQFPDLSGQFSCNMWCIVGIAAAAILVIVVVSIMVEFATGGLATPAVAMADAAALGAVGSIELTAAASGLEGGAILINIIPAAAAEATPLLAAGAGAGGAGGAGAGFTWAAVGATAKTLLYGVAALAVVACTIGCWIEASNNQPTPAPTATNITPTPGPGPGPGPGPRCPTGEKRINGICKHPFPP